MKFHHIGIACKDLNIAKEWVKSTHSIAEEIGPAVDELQNASFIILRTEDGFVIELIAGDQVATFVKKGIHLYHICYAVNDLDKTIDDLKEKGAIVISPPKPAKLFEDNRIAFLNTPLGIIELIEESE